MASYLIELALAAASMIKIRNHSITPLLNVSVASSPFGFYLPCLFWPRVESHTLSGGPQFSGYNVAGLAISFTFDTSDWKTCYPTYTWTPYEYHRLGATDKEMVILIEEPVQNVLRYSLIRSHRSTGDITCIPKIPLHIQIQNGLRRSLYNLRVFHENDSWPFSMSPACSWPHVEMRSVSELRESRHKLPGENTFGIEFVDADGEICRIGGLWSGRAEREIHTLEATDELLVITIQKALLTK